MKYPQEFSLRPRPNVELFMRLTKLNELSSWKVWRLAQLSSCECVWIGQHVLSVCYRRMERLTIVSGTNVELHMRRTRLKYRFSRGQRRSSRKWKKYCDKEIQLKLSLRSVKNSKLVSGKKPRNLSPRYGHVILISGYFVFTAVNWSQHGCAISGSRLPHQLASVTISHWFPCGADGLRLDVRSRDYQNFLDG